MTPIAEDAKRCERSILSSKLLTRVLLANAGFSAVTGVILAVGAIPLSRWLGIPTWLIVAVGVGLLAFSLGVAVVGRRPRRSTVRLVTVAVADFAVFQTVGLRRMETAT